MPQINDLHGALAVIEEHHPRENMRFAYPLEDDAFFKCVPSRALYAKRITRVQIADAKSAAQEMQLKAIFDATGMLQPIADMLIAEADILQERFTEMQNPQTIFKAYEFLV